MKPLHGTRVLDLARGPAASFCAQNLGHMGADVIRIEPPREREPKGHSAAAMTMNHGKRGLAADVERPEAVELVRRLARAADVLVHDYRPGAAERLRLGPGDLFELNPRLVHCSVTGFGATGPYAGRAGHDLIAQAMSGIVSVTGDEAGSPARAGVSIAELAAGLFAAYGILCALEHRDRTGEGQVVDTSLLEAAMALTVWEATEYWVTGRVPGPLGSAHRLTAPYQAIQAADGYFTVGANNDKLFAGLCRAIGRPDLLDDARFAGRAERLRHRAALIPEIEKTTVAETRAFWLARLDAEGVPGGPINDYAEALADPHTLARRMVIDLVHPEAGPIKALGVPVKLSDTPGAVDRAAPAPGQHTAEILAELGYGEAEQRALQAAGVI